MKIESTIAYPNEEHNDIFLLLESIWISYEFWCENHWNYYYILISSIYISSLEMHVNVSIY